MVGININCKERDFCSLILMGLKKVETRKSPSLRPYVGMRVGLIMTGRGKAVLIGYATIKSEEVGTHFSTECTEGTSYDKMGKGGVRYGYWLTDVVGCDPRIITSRGIVARKI